MLQMCLYSATSCSWLVHCLTVTRFLLGRLYYDSMDYVVKIYIPTIEQ